MMELLINVSEALLFVLIVLVKSAIELSFFIIRVERRSDHPL